MVKLQVFGNNSKTVNNIKNMTWGKNDQHIKIYLPCNFEVNPMTHFGVISLFSSNFQNFNTFHHQKPAILPYVLFLVTAAMLVGARHHRTQF
jgi:hypothetical protein